MNRRKREPMKNKRYKTLAAGSSALVPFKYG
jgi:hypothetical protein